MRILGIDPGLQTTGFGVVDVDGARLSYVGSGTIKTTHLALGDLPGRLKVIFDGICEITERYQPDTATIEIIFVNVNPQSTLLLGQARGASITALVSRGLPVAEYTALQMKKAVVGHGRAAKTQVQEMVRRLLQLPGLPGILETRRGSGTVVRALPGDARHAAGTFADYLAAFRILMPPLVAASLPAVSPSVILELERLLPSAGASLRNGDMKTFI